MWDKNKVTFKQHLSSDNLTFNYLLVFLILILYKIMFIKPMQHLKDTWLTKSIFTYILIFLRLYKYTDNFSWGSPSWFLLVHLWCLYQAPSYLEILIILLKHFFNECIQNAFVTPIIYISIIHTQVKRNYTILVESRKKLYHFNSR